MSDLKPKSDPSMEDILASINRIIAEDRRSSEGTPRPVPRAPAAATSDEVLELTEAISPDGSLRHLAPGAARPREGTPPRLVSTPASALAGASFARLAALPRAAAAAELTPGSGRSLEELVRDALRPLLQSWLDDHLPDIVERLVREEIARIAGAAPPD